MNEFKILHDYPRYETKSEAFLMSTGSTRGASFVVSVGNVTESMVGSVGTTHFGECLSLEMIPTCAPDGSANDLLDLENLENHSEVVKKVDKDGQRKYIISFSRLKSKLIGYGPLPGQDELVLHASVFLRKIGVKHIIITRSRSKKFIDILKRNKIKFSSYKESGMEEY